MSLDLVPDKENVNDINYTEYSSQIENFCTDEPCPSMLIQVYTSLNQTISNSVTMCWGIVSIIWFDSPSENDSLLGLWKKDILNIHENIL